MVVASRLVDATLSPEALERLQTVRLIRWLARDGLAAIAHSAERIHGKDENRVRISVVALR